MAAENAIYVDAERGEQLEKAADDLLKVVNGEMRTYTDRHLARKMRLERLRLPELNELSTPSEAESYLFEQEIRSMVDTGRLTKLQGAILMLVFEGISILGISLQFGLTPHRVRQVLKAARKRLTTGGSPYDGLYEVYWQEVNRYVYRKR